MSKHHHAGAVSMVDQMGRSHGDARLRFMAPAIRHAQQARCTTRAAFSAVVIPVRNVLGDNAN
ncbi:hypothetical protein [Bradyrhizobium sp. WYCCWR 12699]|uniref:hypothetical protein n=1 Tax=Bradyrhizobium sp. WYCCWR 12699 TaxID=3064203 RepID=UPI0028A42C36|nr:hypothetical protein [Bradyrhizobium sp. WYCCWR 12699]MDT4739903.1 hypothetical protein [Bradyrhizobium sp. WYCCWR 12699]